MLQTHTGVEEQCCEMMLQRHSGIAAKHGALTAESVVAFFNHCAGFCFRAQRIWFNKTNRDAGGG
jgi:hypothetical protein